MIDGCSNHGCVVTGETGGQHTNSICNCVKLSQLRDHISIMGVCVGNSLLDDSMKLRDVREWLCNGGLRDILAMERKEQNEELVMLRKMVDDYQMWLDEARQQLAQHVQWLKDARSEFHIE